MTDTESVAVHEHRSRLLEGMAHAVASKGYAETTIADIVREASVSRRTFYEHFETKSQCLTALYEAASHNALQVLRQAIQPGRSWDAQVQQALAAYLDCLSSNPVLLRTLFIEILGLGPTGLQARRRSHDNIAQLMLEVINAPGSGVPRQQPLSPEMAMAVVGGIHEMVLHAIEQGRADRLGQLLEPASRLVRAVIHAA